MMTAMLHPQPVATTPCTVCPSVHLQRLEQIHFPSRLMFIIFHAAGYRLIAIVPGAGRPVVESPIDRYR